MPGDFNSKTDPEERAGRPAGRVAKTLFVALPWAGFVLSGVGLALSGYLSTQIHPKKPVIVECSDGVEERLDRLMAEFEKRAKK